MKRSVSVMLSCLLGVLLVGSLAAASAVAGTGFGGRVAVDVARSWQGQGLASASPFGNYESARGVEGGVEVKGWTIDPDRTDPIYVWVTVDGVGRHLYANVGRPDVGAVYPAYGPNHGFRGAVPATAGSHVVCVTASNVGPGEHTPLGCRTVAVPSASPFGNFESAGGVLGAIEVTGWIVDPSDPTTALYAWVTIDGVGQHVLANKSRPDVAAALPGSGPKHGFRNKLPAAAGTHTVCVTAANVGSGSHTRLGCRMVTVPDTSPFGNFERASAVAGGVEVAGWAIDPDAAGPVYVWVTVDGVGRHLYADATRPDVGDVYPDHGPLHGFSGTLKVSPGTHTVCVTAANTGPGDHTPLGCRTVTYPLSVPVGAEPKRVLVVPDIGRAFVLNYADGTLSVVDTVTNAVIDTIEAGPNPGGLDYDPSQGLLWVRQSGVGGINTWVLIDAVTLEIVDTIDLAGGPLAGIDAARGVAYLLGQYGDGNGYELTLTVVDTATREVVRTETLTYPLPTDARLDVDAGVLYVNVWPNNQLFVIDLESMEVTHEYDTTRFAPSGSPNLPHAYDPDAGLLYVTFPYGPLYVVDASTGEAVASLPKSDEWRNYYSAVVLDDAAGVAYVAHVGHTIDVVDRTTFEVIDTYPVRTGLFRRDQFDPSTGTLYLVGLWPDELIVLKTR